MFAPFNDRAPSVNTLNVFTDKTLRGSRENVRKYKVQTGIDDCPQLWVIDYYGVTNGNLKFTRMGVFTP